jgi:hypothetical protein
MQNAECVWLGGMGPHTVRGFRNVRVWVRVLVIWKKMYRVVIGVVSRVGHPPAAFFRSSSMNAFAFAMTRSSRTLTITWSRDSLAP